MQKAIRDKRENKLIQILFFYLLISTALLTLNGYSKKNWNTQNTEQNHLCKQKSKESKKRKIDLMKNDSRKCSRIDQINPKAERESSIIFIKIQL
jgi:uncharacterized membrane protein YfhO